MYASEQSEPVRAPSIKVRDEILFVDIQASSGS